MLKLRSSLFYAERKLSYAVNASYGQGISNKFFFYFIAAAIAAPGACEMKREICEFRKKLI